MFLTSALFAVGLGLGMSLSANANELRVSLISISPRPLALEAYGDSQILFEEKKEDETKYVLFFKQNIIAEEIFSPAVLNKRNQSDLETKEMYEKLLGYFNNSLKSKIVRVASNEYDPRFQRLPKITAEALRNNDEYREVRMTRLQLTQTQAEDLLASFEKTSATAESPYHPARSNSNTFIRDAVFSEKMVGKLFFQQQSPNPNEKAVEKKIEKPFSDLLREALDEISINADDALKNASANHGRAVFYFFPQSLSAQPKFAMTQSALNMHLGLKSEFESAADYYETMSNVPDRLADILSNDDPLVAALRSFYSPKENEPKSVLVFDSLFTEKKLRQALAEVTNQTLSEKKPLLDTNSEVKYTSEDEEKDTPQKP